MNKNRSKTQIRHHLLKLMELTNCEQIEVYVTKEYCRFYYKNGKQFTIETTKVVRNTTKPKKLMFEIEGKIKKFKSIHEASKKLLISRPTLTNIVNGKTKRSYSLEYDGIKYLGYEQ